MLYHYPFRCSGTILWSDAKSVIWKTQISLIPLHFIGRVNTACVVLKDTSFISSDMYIEFVLPLIDFRCNRHQNVKGGGAGILSLKSLDCLCLYTENPLKCYTSTGLWVLRLFEKVLGGFGNFFTRMFIQVFLCLCSL